MSAPTAHSTPTPTPKKRYRYGVKAWPYAAIPVALFVGIGLGLSSGQDATSAPSAAPAATITVTAAPMETYTAADATADAPAAPAVQSGPLTTFSDGVYEVGTGEGQVAPGKYKSDNAGGYGYYALLKNNDGALGDIINNEISEGPMRLTVPKTAGYVKVTGCTFTKI